MGLDQDRAQLLTTAAGCGGATCQPDSLGTGSFAHEQDLPGLWWCCTHVPSPSALLTWLLSLSLLALNLFCSLDTQLPCTALVPGGVEVSAGPEQVWLGWGKDLGAQ